jgi:hypothetical protein
MFAGLLPASTIALAMIYPLQFMLFSHSPVGRIAVVLAILLYAYIDVLFGLLAVAIVVLYYQSDISENMTLLNDGSSDGSTVNDASAEFRKEYCPHGKLVFKGQEVNPSVAQHVFPFVENPHKCNVCSPDCQINIVEEGQDGRQVHVV